mmetsp:Transcript_19705/g.66724  ORF Transcript_19705/g.66724 Transcript_19705/m.66724 type:complete len:156 (+) Transcript_19705:126-593(+)
MVAWSQGGTPPPPPGDPSLPQLSREDAIRVRELRRDVWLGGMQGMFYGSIAGAAGAYALPSLGVVPRPVARKWFPAVVLLTGCACSYLGSLVAGRNGVQYVGDIFRRGAAPPALPSQAKRLQEEEHVRQHSEDGLENRRRAIARARRARNERGDV